LRQVDVQETDVPGVTQPAANEIADNRMLEDMRWRHAGATDGVNVDVLTRYVTFEIREHELVKIEPAVRTLAADEKSADDVSTDDDPEAVDDQQAE
jgi:hypothetical protein